LDLCSGSENVAIRLCARILPETEKILIWLEAYDPTTESYLMPDLGYLEEAFSHPFTTREPASPERFYGGPVRILVDWSEELGPTNLRPMIAPENVSEAVENFLVSLRADNLGEERRGSALRYLLDLHLTREGHEPDAAVTFLGCSADTNGEQIVSLSVASENPTEAPREVHARISAWLEFGDATRFP